MKESSYCNCEVKLLKVKANYNCNEYFLYRIIIVIAR